MSLILLPPHLRNLRKRLLHRRLLQVYLFKVQPRYRQCLVPPQFALLAPPSHRVIYPILGFRIQALYRDPSRFNNTKSQLPIRRARRVERHCLRAYLPALRRCSNRTSLVATMQIRRAVALERVLIHSILSPVSGQSKVIEGTTRGVEGACEERVDCV